MPYGTCSIMPWGTLGPGRGAPWGRVGGAGGLPPAPPGRSLPGYERRDAPLGVGERLLHRLGAQARGLELLVHDVLELRLVLDHRRVHRVLQRGEDGLAVRRHRLREVR